MIMISKSVVFFILGFVSAIILLVSIAVISAIRENKQRQILFDKLLESARKSDEDEKE